MTSTVPVPVDAERLLSWWWRTRPEVAAIVDDRVYTELPARPVFPLLRFTLIDETPDVVTWPVSLSHTAAAVQVDCYGGPKQLARQLRDTALAVLLDGFVTAHAAGTVTGVSFGPTHYLPDTVFTPPKPRYVSALTVHAHP